MPPPIDHPLNLTTQAVLTWGSWGVTALMLGWAIYIGLRERTPFYVLLIFAAMLSAFAEPLYDVAFMLWFYAPGMWTHFSAFGIPQPNWTHSGYVVLYAGAALMITRQIYRGRVDRNALFGWALVEFAMSCTFEMGAISFGAYEYWGPHVFRVLQYPLIIGVLEATQVVCFSVAAAQLRSRARHPAQLLGLLVIFPITFFGANFGAGWPLIIALHFDGPPSVALVTLGTVLAFGLALCAIRMAGGLIPSAGEREASGERQLAGAPAPC